MYHKGPVCVLVAPLDWGLGHATRCIPIIRELINRGCRVLVAASGAQQILLKQEFPHLEYLEIPGYQIRYGPGLMLKWSLLLKLPAILRKIKREHVWLERCMQLYPVDAVISDNRYGLFHKKKVCIFITHQLFIQTGGKVMDRVKLTAGQSPSAESSGSWTDRLILKWNYRLISNFSECWVPDQETDFSFAGKLSHPPVLPPLPLKYIGLLSRFRQIEKPIVKNSLLILLSGPEPQRSVLENILISQPSDMNLRIMLVRGLPGDGEPDSSRRGLNIFNHLPSEALNEMIATSEFVIARSGYSTVMDLLRMKKAAILIPTPGQTEQEYLGRYLHNKKWMYTVSQNKFNLEKTLSEFKKCEFKLPEILISRVPIVLEEFLQLVLEHGKS